MNAKEANKKSRENGIPLQYTEANARIDRAIELGLQQCFALNNGAVYPEVAEMLAKDGFNVKSVLREDDHHSYTEISFKHAKDADEDAVGIVTVVDETNIGPFDFLGALPFGIAAGFEEFLATIGKKADESKNEEK